MWNTMNFELLMLSDSLLNLSHLQLIFSNSLFMWEEVLFDISKDVINVGNVGGVTKNIKECFMVYERQLCYLIPIIMVH